MLQSQVHWFLPQLQDGIKTLAINNIGWGDLIKDHH